MSAADDDAARIRGLLSHVDELEAALVEARADATLAMGVFNEKMTDMARLRERVAKLIEVGGELTDAALGYVDLDLLNKWAAAVQDVRPFLGPGKEQG